VNFLSDPPDAETLRRDQDARPTPIHLRPFSGARSLATALDAGRPHAGRPQRCAGTSALLPKIIADTLALLCP